MNQRYKCVKCGFSWTPKSGNIPKRCPYCGRADSLEVSGVDAKFMSAEDLLK